MKEKIEKVKKLWELEGSTQFDGEKQNAHDKAEKLFNDIRKTDNSTLEVDEYLSKVELIGKHDAKYSDATLEELRERYRIRQRRKKIIEEMLDMWEKLGGKI